MSEKTENGDVEASARLLGDKKRISVSGDLDRTKNKETTKQLKIVEKESEYFGCTVAKKVEISQKRALRQEKQNNLSRTDVLFADEMYCNCLSHCLVRGKHSFAQFICVFAELARHYQFIRP